MQGNDPKVWMLAEAVELLEAADRLQRQFFRFGQMGEAPCWEPPIDMYADDGDLAVLVALPAVVAMLCGFTLPLLHAPYNIWVALAVAATAGAPTAATASRSGSSPSSGRATPSRSSRSRTSSASSKPG